jgi:hypothetical protein
VIDFVSRFRVAHGPVSLLVASVRAFSSLLAPSALWAVSWLSLAQL